MDKYPQNPLDFIKYMQEHMPRATPTKSGYEIRTKVLEMAQTQAFNDYHFKVGQVEAKGKSEGADYVHTVEYPGAEKVLEIADQFLAFVNNKDSDK